ncbi:MAG: DUF5357 domain-containing protein, partial [Microcoleus sp. SIO2G3]|nr:DUF5357 domain-containing protein [Microcoleus sp. SIO2G3]
AMSELFRLLRDLFFINLIVNIWQRAKPPKTFSWQTLYLLSLFSWIMSLLARTEYVRDALAAMGWLFLTLGTAWALGGRKFRIPFFDIDIQPGPWVSGALNCIFIAASFPDLPDSVPYVLWPLISSFIASTTSFLKPSPALTIPKPSTRQNLAIVILANAILSCWIAFHFTVRDWLVEYPSIANGDISRSTFVNYFGLPGQQRRQQVSRGVSILSSAGDILTDRLDGRPWAEAERFLVDRDVEIARIEQQVQTRLDSVNENSLWQLRALPARENGNGYSLLLQALWQGPSSYDSGFYLTRSCDLNRAINLTNRQLPPGTIATQVRCGSISDPIPVEQPSPNSTPTNAPA